MMKLSGKRLHNHRKTHRESGKIRGNPRENEGLPSGKRTHITSD